MTAKKVLSMALSVIVAAGLLAGCGKTAQPAQKTEEASKAVEAPKDEVAKSDEKPYIAIVSKGWQHQFWQAVKQGAEQASKDFNVEMTFEGPEGDAAIDKQIEMIDTALAKKPAALVLAACDSKSVIPQVQKAKEMGIPVVGFDSGVDSDIPVTTCATDNSLAAGEAADKMAEAIGGEGEVAVVVHDQVSATGVGRRDGFVNRIKEKYPNIEIVDIQYGGGDHLKSTDLTKAIIQAHPNLKGIFGANEGSAIGVINGVTEMNMVGKIVIVGYDAGKQQKDAVRSGVMLGAISQDPVGIGYKAVEAAVKAMNGETLPEITDTGYKWYDKTNMDLEEFKPLLYD
ncbi:ABC transporter substrate-binding protein [Petroclostridium sp. X23]|uniref:ABC transporter substrate-binding protein n=1 Tax=Petroclostridium sp. X23 TaxID=3045146 RepID=UPI0024ADB3F0|nr:ABC transporter substrate-binding protein [Petroclostridium sp. X23]WHH58076.1 ABC transporter substrate-binding protein [Petroclostridium sp. X23]